MESNKILDYILTPTPEQIQKLVDNLPKIKAALK
jgi:hypothetical protein